MSLHIVSFETSWRLFFQIKSIHNFSSSFSFSVDGDGSEIRMCVIFDKIKLLQTVILVFEISFHMRWSLNNTIQK